METEVDSKITVDGIKIEIELLTIDETPNGIIKRFNCGVGNLNDYLKYNAAEYDRIGEGKTTLLIDKTYNRVMGYFTIKCSSMSVEDPEMNPGQPRVIPGVEIARFAMDSRYQRKHIGSGLFINIC